MCRTAVGLAASTAEHQLPLDPPRARSPRATPSLSSAPVPGALRDAQRGAPVSRRVRATLLNLRRNSLTAPLPLVVQSGSGLLRSLLTRSMNGDRVSWSLLGGPRSRRAERPGDDGVARVGRW